LGTGIISTALKSGKDLGELTAEVSRFMMTLNKAASEAMQEVGVHACTDITGFGLLGHAYEMAKGSKVSMRIVASKVPLFKEAIPLVSAGFVPGGTHNNRYYLDGKILLDTTISWEISTLLFDAQTSGGLLISVAQDKTDRLLQELRKRGVETIAVIGEVTAEREFQVYVTD
jgi:selenide, water dikinase